MTARPIAARIATVLALCALAAIIAAGTAFRLANLSGELYGDDEVLAMAPFAAESTFNYVRLEHAIDPPMHPVFFFTLHLFGRVFGKAIPVLRMWSIFWAVLTIPLTYLLGSRLFSRWSGLIAAALLAYAPFHMHYSQLLRPYSLMCFLVVLSVYTFVLAFSSRKWPLLFLHCFVNLLLLNTHLFGLFLVAAEGVHLLLFYFRKDYRYVISWGVFQAAWLGVAVYWMHLYGIDGVVKANRWETIIPVDVWQQLSHVYLDNCWNLHLLVFAIATALLGLLTVAVSLWKDRGSYATRQGFRHPVVFVFLWMILPPILLYLHHLNRGNFFPRYLIHAPIAMYLLIGACASSRRLWILNAGFAVLIGALCVSATSFNLRHVEHEQRGIKELREYLDANVHPEDTVVIINTPEYTPIAFLTYRPRVKEFIEVWPPALDTVWAKCQEVIKSAPKQTVWVISDIGNASWLNLQEPANRAGCQVERTGFPQQGLNVDRLQVRAQ